PTDKVVTFMMMTEETSPFWRGIVTPTVWAYLLAIPVTACLAKRGLFLGMDPGRICFPGEEARSGNYPKEREILGNVGIRTREAPIDLWLLIITWMLGEGLDALNMQREELPVFIFSDVFFLLVCIVAFARRGRTDRA